MIAVDASAMVAVLLREPGFLDLGLRMRREGAAATHGVSVHEAVLAVARVTRNDPRDVDRQVRDFMAGLAIELRPIRAPETAAALDAFARYGKGRGHPARLNLGDCFSYGCARAWGLPLLFVGEDFAATDIPPA